eukprot:TRINITY_DN5048_c0_g3_i1.p1 TRINITY_DN5048_c0_g3~~TRINITY_DN5048_c0_g3_i1.p1  ORF type:complete len:500 (+),score=95.86 TRINITY_DN5048_c0_g3_i1:147-1646(+)
MTLPAPSSSVVVELDRVLSNGFEFLEQLCKDTPPYTDEGKAMAKLLLDYFHSDEKKMLYVVLWAITREIERTQKEDVVFRESNVQTELLFSYFYMPRGRKYLRYLLDPIIHTVSSIVSSESKGDVTNKFANKAEQIIESIQGFIIRFTTIDKIPSDFLKIMRHMRKEMNIKFQAAQTQNIIQSLLFLRVICPAIINPSLIREELQITSDMRKGLVWSARILQNLANGSMFDDAIMALYNPLLLSNIDIIRIFFLRITMEQEIGTPELKKPKQSKIDKSKREIILQNIYHRLKENAAFSTFENSYRHSLAINERDNVLSMNSSTKWKIYKKWEESTSYTLSSSYHMSSVKIEGVIKTEIHNVLKILKAKDKPMIFNGPLFMKSHVIKEYFDGFVDLCASYQMPYPLQGTKEYLFCRKDYKEADQNIVVFWTIEDDGVIEICRRGEFDTTGFLLKISEINPDHTNVTIISITARKGMKNSFESVENTLHNTFARMKYELEA